MKVTELRTVSIDELTQKLQAFETEVRDNRRSLAAGELANPRVIRRKRRDIAQIKTIIAEKRREETNNKENNNA